MTIDLKPAVERTTDVVRSVRDDQLGAPTPCPAYTLGDLLDHVGGLSFAFTAAATKDVAEVGDQGPSAGTRPGSAMTGGPGSRRISLPSPTRGTTRRRGPG